MHVCHACGQPIPPKKPKKEKKAKKEELVMPKFALHTDMGQFRKALWLAGYHDLAANATIFNDKNTESRCLKVWFARTILESNGKQKGRLVDELVNQFGDRLIECGEYTSCHESYYPHPDSYIIRLTL